MTKRRSSRRPVYRSTRRHHFPLFEGFILPGALGLASILYFGKGVFYFDNGSGGAHWQIGAPVISATDAHITRSWPEIRAFALQLVNRDRTLNGLSSLREDPLLSTAAQNHAEDMLKRGYFAHNSPEGYSASDRLRLLGGRGGAGENISYAKHSLGATLSYAAIERMQKGWMYSDGHRANILSGNYRRFGFGVAVDPLKGEIYGVQTFAP